jgi:hypothetical protein
MKPETDRELAFWLNVALVDATASFLLDTGPPHDWFCYMLPVWLFLPSFYLCDIGLHAIRAFVSAYRAARD